MLSPELRNAFQDSNNTLRVSAATAWEIANRSRLGKLNQAQADNLVLASTDAAFAQVQGPAVLG